MEQRNQQPLTVWYQDLPKSEQEEFKKVLLSSHLVLDKLLKIVYNRVIVGERSSLDDYDSPSWAYRQADRNGYTRAYKELETLIKSALDH